MEKLEFATQVLGAVAAGRLREKKVTQTLRSPNCSIVNALIHGSLTIGDRVEVTLDNEFIGHAYPADVDRINGASLTPADAERGGFDSIEDLDKALQRGGYRFKKLDGYQFYRIRFDWKGALTQPEAGGS